VFHPSVSSAISRAWKPLTADQRRNKQCSITLCGGYEAGRASELLILALDY